MAAGSRVGSPEEGDGNPLQYSCLENPMDGGAWWDTVHGGRTELDMTGRDAKTEAPVLWPPDAKS